MGKVSPGAHSEPITAFTRDAGKVFVGLRESDWS